jgi:cold shock CspA family protein
MAHSLNVTAAPKGAVWVKGRVKWFDPVRRYGFIVPDDGETDVHLRWLVLQACGIAEAVMRPDVRVEYQCAPSRRQGMRPEARIIRVIEL